MIDSILYYGAGTKAGSLATAVGDFGGKLQRFARNLADEGGNVRAVLDGAVATQIEIVTQRPVLDLSVFPPTTVTPRQVLAGYALWVATEEQDVADLLWALPLKICRVQLDRATGKIIRSNVVLATLRALWPEPVPAGSNYNFPTIS